MGRGVKAPLLLFKIVCWKSTSEKCVLCWKFQHRLKKCVGISGWLWEWWDWVLERVCWKCMSEMRVVCGKMPGSCNVAVEKAKMGVEIMQK